MKGWTLTRSGVKEKRYVQLSLDKTNILLAQAQHFLKGIKHTESPEKSHYVPQMQGKKHYVQT